MEIERNCFLCYKVVENLIGIFSEEGNSLKISSTLTKHLWFEVKEADHMNNFICTSCWFSIESFHIFYNHVLEVHLEKLDFVKLKLEEIEIINYSNDSNTQEVKYNEDVEARMEKKLENIKDEYNDEKVEVDCFPNEDSDSINYGPNEDNTNTSEDDSDHSYVESKPKLVTKRKSHTKNNSLKNSRSPKISKDKTLTLAEDEKIREYFKMDCELCSKTFYIFQDVKTHYRIAHNLNGYLRCCNKKFIKRVKVLEHIHRHLHPTDFTCQLCNKVYADKRGLLEHMERHLPTEEKRYKCTLCPKSYIKISDFNFHKKKHLKEEKRFCCDECGKSFLTNSILQSHVRGVHQGANTHVCDICAKVFKSKVIFQKHHQSVHKNISSPKVQCPECGVWLKHKYYLPQHLLRHKESKIIFNCPICEKPSSNQKALGNHIRSVHTDKVHKCTVCEKEFKKTVSLKEHMATHTGEVLYYCTVCPKTFNSSANMYSHRKKMHPKEWEEIKRVKELGN